MRPGLSIPVDVKISELEANDVAACLRVGPRGRHRDAHGIEAQPARRRLRCAILSALFGLMFADPLRVSATAIAILRTPQRIFLAADSLVIDGRGEPLGSMCKIRPVGAHWVGVSGALASREYNLPNIIDGLKITPKHTLWQTAELLASAVGEPLSTVVTENYRMGGTRYRSFIMDGSHGVAAGLIMVGVMNGVPAAVRLVFMVERMTTPGEPLTIITRARLCPGEWCPSGAIHSMLGVTGPADIVLDLAPSWMRKIDGGVARRMVQMQIDELPKYVGPPIDVLEISRDGSRWLNPDPKSLCRASPDTVTPKPKVRPKAKTPPKRKKTDAWLAH